jgi:hypothetical protein
MGQLRHIIILCIFLLFDFDAFKTGMRQKPSPPPPNAQEIGHDYITSEIKLTVARQKLADFSISVNYEIRL